MEVTDILKERAVVYGNYDKGVDCRAAMMLSLQLKHLDSQNKSMTVADQIAFGDILLKVMRAASDPSYIDSWADLEGYARLIKEMKMKEQQDANNY
jgi:hypothetical protein